MVMGDQGALCGLPWPVCPVDLGQRLSSRAGAAWYSGCGRRWPLDEVEPCPWPGQVRLWDQQGSERVVRRSPAAHPSAARLVAIEEDP
jgi:hypothetical protein